MKMDIEREKKTEGQRIQDEKGNVLGYFLTEAQHTQAMYALAHREIDREEAENAAKVIPRPKWDGKNGMTTEDVLAMCDSIQRDFEGQTSPSAIVTRSPSDRG